MATKLQNFSLIRTKTISQSNLKKIRTLRIAQLNKAKFDTMQSFILTHHTLTHEQRSSSYLYMGMLCLFFVQSSLSLFVATWPGFLYNNFLTFQSGPHSTASCQCWQPVLHCESAWGQDLSLCLAIGHCCPLSALCPALTAGLALSLSCSTWPCQN